VNHPALVKTGDEPSFSSVNFSPFAFAEAPRASDISPVPSLNILVRYCSGICTGYLKKTIKFLIEANQVTDIPVTLEYTSSSIILGYY
jgi:hypothetical protein